MCVGTSTILLNTIKSIFYFIYFVLDLYVINIFAKGMTMKRKI